MPGAARPDVSEQPPVTGSPDPIYSQQANEVLDKLEADPALVTLWNGLCDALDLITDKPGSAEARREALRTAAGTAVWRVIVRASGEPDDWYILWHTNGDQVLIDHIGIL